MNLAGNDHSHIAFMRSAIRAFSQIAWKPGMVRSSPRRARQRPSGFRRPFRVWQGERLARAHESKPPGVAIGQTGRW